MYNLNNDGIDHINVFSRAKTELGKQLSNFSNTPFVFDGESFQSVESWWYWYTTGKIYNSIKHLYGYKAKTEGKKYDKVAWVDEGTLALVYYSKLKHNPDINRMLLYSDLPFTHYYVFNSKYVPTKHEWTGSLWNNIRDLIKYQNNFIPNRSFKVFYEPKYSSFLYEGFINELADNEVFVFGSNMNGFHGAGSAGYATFNEIGNKWRKYGYSKSPDGTKGKWAIKGVHEGFQEGSIGRSYALPVIEFPGKKRSLPKDVIINNISKLFTFAISHNIQTCSHYDEKGNSIIDDNHKVYNFLVAYNSQGGSLNGYTTYEMAEMFADNLAFTPVNIIFEKSFHAIMIDILKKR